MPEYGNIVTTPRRKAMFVYTCKEKENATISTQNFRVNEGIRVPQVLVIGPNGENIGVITIEKALQLAREAELDLVEVAPAANPPVCRILDFGKFLFERTKKEREARKAQTKIEVKEIRLRPKTNEHHRGFKTRDARRWITEGNKVRVTIRFRGREIDYPEIALEDLKEIAKRDGRYCCYRECSRYRRACHEHGIGLCQSRQSEICSSPNGSRGRGITVLPP